MPSRPAYFTHRHQPTRAENRPNAYRRGYDANWKKIRDAFLNENPFCLFCNAFAVLVDHITPVNVNPSLRLVWSNLRSLCTDCHADVTTNFKINGVNEPRRRHHPAAGTTGTRTGA
jgi:5-methylcytosine-specific restriction endonuclease McrA